MNQMKILNEAGAGLQASCSNCDWRNCLAFYINLLLSVALNLGCSDLVIHTIKYDLKRCWKAHSGALLTNF